MITHFKIEQISDVKLSTVIAPPPNILPPPKNKSLKIVTYKKVYIMNIKIG